jgi:chorismate dehydratase
MIFGSIRYLNLLPFQVYMKRRFGATQFRQMLRWRRAVPSIINREFARGKVDAAFLSSIASRGRRCTGLGIVADGPVYSVFLLPGAPSPDRESASSNVLADTLGLRGRVLIGDKALRYWLEGGKGIDLSEEWKRRTGMPFVFARLCHNRRGKKIRKAAKEFGSREWKIPRYLLEREARLRGITPAQLQWYLGHIRYRIGWREERSLRLFFRKSRRRVRSVS